MAARPGQGPNMGIFDVYFRRADLDMDGRISGEEAVAFFQGSNLPKHILAQIWMYSDSNKTSFLGRQEFYNALRLVTVAQSGKELTPEIVKAALGPAAAKIPAPQISPAATSTSSGNQMTTQRPILNSMMSPAAQMGAIASTSSQNLGFRGPQVLPNANVNQQTFPPMDGQYLRPSQPPVIPSHPLVGQGFVGGGMAFGPHNPDSSTPSISADWSSGRMGGASVGGTSQVPRGTVLSVTQDGFGPARSGLANSTNPRAEVASADSSFVPPKPWDSLPSFQPSAKDLKPLVVSGNGFSANSAFGDVAFAALPLAKQNASTAAFAASSVSSSSGVVPMTSGLQPLVRPIQSSLQSSSTMLHGGGQIHLTQSMVKQNQHETVQSTLASTPSVVSVGPAGPVSSPSDRSWPKFSQSDVQKYSKVFAEVDIDKDGKITGEEARELFLSWKLPREVLKQVWDLSDQDNDSMLSHREFVIALYLMERYREGHPLPAVLPNSVRYDETLLQATVQPSAYYAGSMWQPRPGFSQQGMPRLPPVIPAGGLKTHTQGHMPRQIDGPGQLVQHKPRSSVSEKHFVNHLGKEEQSVLNSNFQEATVADKKVQELEKEIMDSKEKMEFYRTKMQELVLYKSRCDNRLNEITEKASADKREVELLAKKYEEKYKQVADVASKLTIEEATFRDIQERKLELHNAIVKMEEGGSADGLLQVRADRVQSDLEELLKALNEQCKKHGLHVKSTGLIELPFGWQPGVQEGAADWDEDWDKFEDKGFAVAKELTIIMDDISSPPNAKSLSASAAKLSPDNVSPVGSSPRVDKIEKPFSTGERIPDGESAYPLSEDGSMGRSPPFSPLGRSSLESQSQAFHSAQLGMHDASPRSKENHSDHAGAESTTTSGGKFVDETSWSAAFDTSNDTDSIWDFNAKESDYERHKQNSFFGSGEFGLDSIRTDSPSAASVFGKKEKSPFFADSAPGTPLFNSSSSPRFSEVPEDHSFDSFSRFDSFSVHDSGFFPQHGNLSRFDSIRSTSEQSRGFTFDDPEPFVSTGPFKSSNSQTSPRGSDNWSAF
uniref:Putative calcium-binding protein C800.10c n=1 Tax=Anthurium amnicola TaxID=1678845 RepID=A0A1D1Y914_9ARAE